jgi:SAM-dependent methyltransferase
MRQYDADFFDKLQGGSLSSAQVIVPVVMKLVQPQSVVDIGCGTGTWLSVFQEFGLSDIYGVDGDWVDDSQLEIPTEQFQRRDLTQPLVLGRQFDLAMSLEVAEHLPAVCADSFVDTLVRHAPVVLFSAAIPYQGGRHHLDEQWPEYWASRFLAQGYRVVDCLRDKVWHDERVSYFYRQNMLLFCRPSFLESHADLRKDAEASDLSSLNRIHPLNQQTTLTTAAIDDIREVTQSDSIIVFVDDEKIRSYFEGVRQTIPFLERDGVYWGPPPDDETAARELERLRQGGADYLVITWPAFWWVEFYAGFFEHLRTSFNCVVENERLIVFHLGKR